MGGLVWPFLGSLGIIWFKRGSFGVVHEKCFGHYGFIRAHSAIAFGQKMYYFFIFISRFNNAQHSRATTPKNTSTLVNTLDLVSMGSGSRKTRNKTPTSMAKTPTSNIVGSGTLSRIIEELEKPDDFRILM